MAAGHKFEPRILGFLCNWCCYAGADLAGVSRFQHPPNMRVIRLMCSGRVDPAHVFRAFANGLDAVFIGGCHLNDCHYVTHGNYDALAMVYVCKKLMEYIGLNPERLKLEWVSAGEGIRFAGIMNEFVPQIEKLGPLGKGEDLDDKEWKLKLEAVTKLIPYIKLVLSEKLRVPERTEEAYTEFFAGREFTRLFDESIGDKLALYPQVSAKERDTQKDAVEDAKIDKIINRHKDEARSLIQVLLEIQQENHWISEEVLQKVSKNMGVPMSRIMHIVTFHETFHLNSKGNKA
jgi:F420-non-reducing hydrogenase iron-sulfur subunit